MIKFDAEVFLDCLKCDGIARCMSDSCIPNYCVEKWELQGCSRAGVLTK